MHTRGVAAWRNDRVFNTPLTMVPIFDAGGRGISVPIDHALSDVEGPHLKGRATVGGVFYRGNKFPEGYRNTLFFADAGDPPGAGGFINRMIFDDEHDLVEIAEFRATGASIYPTGLAVDPDGYGIYYANHLFDGAGSIRRITFDCNGNGIGDDRDIVDGTSDDENGNGIPDECDRPGDVNGDGVVNFQDILLVLGAWGDCPDPPDPCPADVNDDGTVNFADVLILLANWS